MFSKLHTGTGLGMGHSTGSGGRTTAPQSFGTSFATSRALSATLAAAAVAGTVLLVARAGHWSDSPRESGTAVARAASAARSGSPSPSPVSPAGGLTDEAIVEPEGVLSRLIRAGAALLRGAAAKEDDDDLFACSSGPRLFSADAVRQARAERANATETPRGATQQTAAAHHYPKDKAASRGRSRSKAAVESALCATPNHGGEPAGAADAGDDAPAHTEAKKKKVEVFTAAIVQRTKAMNIARALLKRLDEAVVLPTGGTRETGNEEADSSSDSSGDSDETDVSLTYHFAASMELDARDDLMSATAEYEAVLAEADARLLAAQQEVDEDDGDPKALREVVAYMLYYLDMSNEREKLYIRREQMRFAAGTGQPKDHTGFVTRAELSAEEDARDDEDLERERQMKQRAAALRRGPSATTHGKAAGRATVPAKTPVDHLLAHSAGKRGSGANEDDEVFEDDWEDEDDEEAAAFMEYLAQDDAAGRLYSRAEVADRRRAMRDDPNAVRLIAPDGRDFGDLMDDWYRRPRPNDDDGDDGDYEDEEDWEDEAWQDHYPQGADLEDDGTTQATPWTAEERDEFESELMDRVFELGEAWGVTVAMGEREAAREEERIRQRREARHAERQRLHAQSTATRGNAPVGRQTAEQGVRAADGDDEWEDVNDDAPDVDAAASDRESDWEEVDDKDEQAPPPVATRPHTTNVRHKTEPRRTGRH